MVVTFLHLVKFKSKLLDPDEDPLVGWLYALGFWGDEVVLRINQAKGYLPLDIETDFRNAFDLPIDGNTNCLFSKLLCSCTGIDLHTLGYNGDDDYRDPYTCVGKILALKLGRVQDNTRFKALSIAFDPRAQFLIGARKVPYT